MSTSEIKVRTAIACEELRQEANGKPFAIGIQNPIVGRGKPRDDGTWPPYRFYFLLSLDVPEAGSFEMRFRLRPLPGKGGGSSAKIKVEFVEAAKNIPFAIGPMRVRPDAEAVAFALERLQGDGDWEEVANWQIRDMAPSDG